MKRLGNGRLIISDFNNILFFLKVLAAFKRDLLSELYVVEE